MSLIETVVVYEDIYLSTEDEINWVKRKMRDMIAKGYKLKINLSAYYKGKQTSKSSETTNFNSSSLEKNKEEEEGESLLFSECSQLY